MKTNILRSLIAACALPTVVCQFIRVRGGRRAVTTGGNVAEPDLLDNDNFMGNADVSFDHEFATDVLYLHLHFTNYGG